jgi:endonuclease/exonuclease/phosphatase family metal-dependent hydrolase
MGEVTVATLNLKKGELRWGERAPLIMRQLVELRPDIVGFQEVDLRLDQGNWLCKRFNDLIWEPGAPQYRIHHMANPRENVVLEALAIMTHLSVVGHQGYDYLVRNRVAHRVRVDAGGVALDVWNTPLHHVQDAEGNELRLRQAETLLRWMERDGDDVPKVLVGDFNAPPGTPPIALLKEHLRSAHEALHGDEPQMTWPSPLVADPPYPGKWVVDYIFVSAQVRIVEARTAFDRPGEADPTLYPSDHFGLLARLAIGG